MKLEPKLTIAQHFQDVEDPRVERTKAHQLIDIITIAICAVICGADGWTDIESYGHAKYSWLKKFLELPNGIPSHDTFRRVFARIDPEQFQSCFLNWIKSVEKVTNQEIVAIDGKTLRGSYDTKSGQSAIHMISAWANSSSLVLAQRKVNEKSNEITAIPELLKVLEIRGCIVTIDAMGCQKEIVSKIAEKEADYLIAIKKNQPTLYENIKNLFNQAVTNSEEFELSHYQTEESGHGREEIRNYWMLTNVNNLLDPEEKWKNFSSVGMVCSERIVNGKRSKETRYYISSLKSNAEEIAASIRNHWGVENSFHWILDVAFNEDNSRIRSGNAPQNFAVLRHIAVNLLKQEKSQKTGIKNKRLKAGWDNQYLERILNLS